MNVALDNLALWLCVALAATMGYAIQRGATCTVAAVDELVSQRSGKRLKGMLEASLWVLGCLLLAQATGLLLRMPPGFGLTTSAVFGGLLLGLGAYINRACVFGAVARLGSGRWAYLLTPLGYFVGCALFQWLLGHSPAQRLAEPSWALRLPTAVAWAALGLMLWRTTRPAWNGHSLAVWRRQVRAAWLEKVWSPHAATLVIGLTFVLMFLLAGPWAYTDVLGEWAMRRFDNSAARALLLAARASPVSRSNRRWSPAYMPPTPNRSRWTMDF